MSEYIPTEIVAELRKIDLLTYFKNYRPDELIKNGHTDYVLKHHDSLHLDSEGWYRWSNHTYGKNAIDYLTIVEGYTFIDACKILLDATKQSVPVKYTFKKHNSHFRLPEPDINNDLVINYLTKERMIDKDIISFFIKNNQIYQDKHYKNAVFVGYDNGVARYAFKRSIT